MNISNNLINRYIPQQTNNSQTNISPQINNASNTNSEPTGINTLGQSLLNANVPVSYTKIADINIPGLKDKASVFRLSNGQKVVILPKKGQTYIKTTYNVGSLNETDDIRGISHFIEHNLFNGSKNLAPKEYDQKVCELGGSTNASTSFDYTDYYIRLQLLKDNSLEEAIKLNSLLTQYPSFPPDQMEKEKEPVKSEIDMCKDDTTDVTSSIALKNLFGIQTNSSNFIIGTKDNINALTREKVLDYFNTWYTPDNAVTVITGDVDVNETINLVSKYYNKKSDLSKAAQRHYEPLTPIDKTIRTDIIQPNANYPEIYMGFAIEEGVLPTEIDKINIMLSVLTSQNSRLSKALDKYGIGLGTEMAKIQNKPDSARALLLSISPSSEEQVEDILGIIYEELTYLANNPPSETELNNIKKSFLRSLNNTGEESSTINSILTSMVLENNFNYYNNLTNVIQSITPEEISALAKKYLDLNKASICVSHTNNSTTQTINSNYNLKSNKAKTVSFGALHNPRSIINERTSKISQYKLPNNMETMIIPLENPNAQSHFNLQFDNNNLDSYPSVAFSLLSIILNRGSIYNNNEAYSQTMEDKDISIHFSVDSTGLCAGAAFYDENIQDAFALIKESLLSPRFTQEEFDRAKKLIKETILAEKKSPYEDIYKEFFPNINIYATKEERLQQIDSITLADVQNLYYQIMSSSQADASLSAPIDEKPYLKDIFHNELTLNMPIFRPYSKQKPPQNNIYTPNTQAKIFTSAYPQSQAEVVQAYKFKDSDNIDDIAKINLLNLILGEGGMSSRLFLDLREKEKLAYHVSSCLDGTKDTATIELSIETTTDSPDPKEGSPENINKALKGFEKNVDLLKNSNVTQQELENAKTIYKTRILNNIETGLDELFVYSSTKSSPYDIHYYEQLLDAIDRVTVDDIKSAANYVFANPPVTSIIASQKTLDSLKLIK